MTGFGRIVGFALDARGATAPEQDGIMGSERSRLIAKVRAGQELSYAERVSAGISEQEEAALRAKGNRLF